MYLQLERCLTYFKKIFKSLYKRITAVNRNLKFFQCLKVFLKIDITAKTGHKTGLVQVQIKTIDLSHHPPAQVTLILVGSKT